MRGLMRMKLRKIVAISMIGVLLCGQNVFAEESSHLGEEIVATEAESEEAVNEGENLQEAEDSEASSEDIEVKDEESETSENENIEVSEEEEGDTNEEDGTNEEVTEKNYTLQYRVHVQDYGWQEWVSNGSLSGTTGESKRLEGIEIVVVDEEGNLAENLHVEYRTHVQTYGWQDWVSDGEMAGTTGESKRLEAIQIRLTGEESENYTIEYQVHAQDFGWLGFVEEEQCSGTAGFSKRLEALKIALRKNEESSMVDGARGYLRKYENTEFNISGHVQNVGDVTGIINGGTIGTVGKSLRIEGLTIQLDTSSAEVAQGDIEYSTHVQDYGWLDTVNAGTYSGTKGESKRVEAIKIQLTGELAEYYDIYYRCHVQNIGWMGWAKNGQAAGSAGYSYRMEAVQIKLVVKGESAPGVNTNYFRDGSSAVERIKSYAGSPYKYGGTTPSGWDCSGCTQWLYKNIFGVVIPRTSKEQAKTGTTVKMSDMSQWKEGDLIFFGSGSSVSHVAMYIGDGYMIHALNSNKGTRIDSVQWFDKADTTTVMMAVKRIL